MKRFAVFGNPIKHSYSPIIHSLFAEQFGFEICYEKCLINKDEFVAEVEKFFDDGGMGLNITVPFKQEAYRFLSNLSERSLEAGSVNTIKKDYNGNLCGDNTDGLGLKVDLVKNLKWNLSNKRVLIIGAGGATRGILRSLFSLNPSQIVIANRTPGKVLSLLSHFKSLHNVSGCSLDNVNKEAPFDIIINATSASLNNEAVFLSDQIISEDEFFCYDLAYSDSLTPFLDWGLKRGAEISDGIGMLVEQAAESFYIWLDKAPQTESVIKYLKNNY